MAAADTRPPDNRLPFRPASCRMTHNPPRNGAEAFLDAKANPTGKDLYRATCFVPPRRLSDWKTRQFRAWEHENRSFLTHYEWETWTTKRFRARRWNKILEIGNLCIENCYSKDFKLKLIVVHTRLVIQKIILAYIRKKDLLRVMIRKIWKRFVRLIEMSRSDTRFYTQTHVPPDSPVREWGQNL